MRALPLVLVATALLFWAAAGADTHVAAQRQVKLEIQQDTLADVLAQWAQQTGFQVISSVEATALLAAPHLSGMYSLRTRWNGSLKALH